MHRETDRPYRSDESLSQTDEGLSPQRARQASGPPQVIRVGLRPATLQPRVQGLYCMPPPPYSPGMRASFFGIRPIA